MAIELYPHNLDAYRRAESLLIQTGKAAIIHPTGTGKSFIAFRLCEEHPQCRVLWLSPSEYIFEVQLASARKNGFSAENIVFYTYARLCGLSEEELALLAPDYIVLDEFHRAGAKEWGRAVGSLLTAYPGVPVLGLSATNIRYLDNQRDMADELFEGHVASRMTLEEAKKELSFEIPPMSGREPVHYFEEPKKNVFEVRSPLASAYPSPAAPSEPSPRGTSAPQPLHSAAEDAFEENRRLLLERDQRAKQQKIDPASLVYRGVLFETYLIFERGDVAYFVDQHAAHERLIYEKLKNKCEARTPLSQPMLMPYILNVNAQEFSFLVSQFEALRALGFDIDEFGGTSVKVSSVPLDLFGMDLEAFFREVLSSMESLRAIRLSDIVRDKLATMACKAAVKGGERLTEEEAKRLLLDMDGDMGLKCPHGRPAVIQRTKSEFEKLFKRIV